MAVKMLGRMEPVDLREFWEDEAREFTPWLAKEENLSELSSTLGMELEVEGTEVLVGPYKADIVARDVSSDAKVVIENQLGRTNHDHLGKIITYASGLDAEVIVWIAKEFSEEHRRAIDYLNDKGSPNLRIFGIEIQLWRISGSPAAPLFKVVSSPNDYTSIIRTEQKELTEAKGIYLEFWTGFREYGLSKKTFLSLRKPRPQHWFSIAVGRSKFSISLTASIQKKRIGCEMYMRGINAKQAYKLLAKDKEAIEQSTGDLEWHELPEGQDCRIVLFSHDIDIAEKENWKSAFEWLLSNAELFHKTFSPRIRALPIIDEADEANTKDELN
jgi:hypothetical protein